MPANRSGGRPAAGGGRWVEVDPDRLERWLAGFAERHGPYTSTVEESALLLTAADEATALVAAPPGAGTPADVPSLISAVGRPYRLGLLLARQGACAIGIATGPTLETSKVDSSYVQSRTAAGGWSQQRFARRRVNQAKSAAGSAVEIAVRLLAPQAERLDAVVTGGDRRTVDTILADVRLKGVAARRAERFLDVGEPRLATLQQAVARARAVLIRVRDPGVSQVTGVESPTDQQAEG
jgi:hypothetical protein